MISFLEPILKRRQEKDYNIFCSTRELEYNYERLYLFVAYLYSKTSNEAKTMEYFEESLKNYSSFNGNFDDFFKNRYYWKDEKQVLQNLAQKYKKRISN